MSTVESESQVHQPPGVHDTQRVALALQRFDQGDPIPLERLCRESLELDAGDRMASATLLRVLEQRGDYTQALAVLERAVQVNTSDGYLYLNLAHCLIGLRRYADARLAARRATELSPYVASMWVNLASACYYLEAYEEGIEAARQVVKVDPTFAKGYTNLGTILKAQGNLSEAIAAFRQSLVLEPNNAVAHTNLMLSLMHEPDSTPHQVLESARHFAQQFELPVATQLMKLRNSPLPERRLKVGFLSPDFTSHAVMYFAEPLLSRLPRHQFELHAYFTHAVGDGVTERARALMDRFRYVPDADQRRIAQIINEDEIDVLVDLAGHTAKNGLRAMAYKPAPVQVTWLGYPGTTGLTTIDWRITDHTADPPGSDAYYTEKLIRLPGCFAVYRPYIRGAAQRFDPRYEVGPTPALSKGCVTFGSCNNIAKIGEAAVAAWSRVLHRVPGSRMLIEGKDLGREAAQVKLRGMFEAQGIEGSRLEFVQRDSARQYLTYHDIDVALDTFPLTGGTTTFDTLWMGVPVVSLEGKTYRERISTTILVNGGFGEYLCRSVDEYVDRAVEMVRDVDALQARRAGQRARMQASVLMDEARFAELFGQALRMIWRRWCKQQEPQGIAAGAPPNPGQDVLVAVEGRRMTLPSALAWLQSVYKAMTDRPTPELIHTCRVVATAICAANPENEWVIAALNEAKSKTAT